MKIKDIHDHVKDGVFYIPNYIDKMSVNSMSIFNQENTSVECDKIVLNNNMQIIREAMFASSNLTFIDLNNLEIIPKGCFRSSNLEFIKMKSVKIIESSAFLGCRNL